MNKSLGDESIRRNYLLFVAIIILVAAFFLFVLFKTSIPYDFLAQPQAGELNLTIIPEKTHLKEGDIFKINLILTNIGNKSVNLWRLKEQISYNILFSYPNGSEVPYICGRFQRDQLTDEELVGINPNDSLTGTIDSKCWILSKGIYSLSAVYHTYPGERMTKPYWMGVERSNNITVFVDK